MAERTPVFDRSWARLRRALDDSNNLGDFLAFLTQDVSRFSEDFHIKALDTTNIWTTGGAGTAAAVVATTANGEIVLACNNNASSLYLPGRRWNASLDCVISVRLQLDTLTNAKVEVGFSDNVNAATLAGSAAGNINSLAATPTLNTGASDVVCAILDSASALTGPSNWRLASAKAGTTALATPTITVAALKAPTAATYQDITVALRRIELGATDDVAAFLYVNGVEMAKINSAATTTATQMLPYVLVKANGATAVNLTVDRFDVWEYRDYTLF